MVADMASIILPLLKLPGDKAVDDPGQDEEQEKMRGHDGLHHRCGERW